MNLPVILESTDIYFFQALTQFKAPIVQHQEDVLLLMAAPHCSLQLPGSHSADVCGTAMALWFSVCMPR